MSHRPSREFADCIETGLDGLLKTCRSVGVGSSFAQQANECGLLFQFLFSVFPLGNIDKSSHPRKFAFELSA